MTMTTQKPNPSRGAVSRLKNEAKGLLHDALRTPRREEALIRLATRLSPRFHGILRKVVPQTSDYHATDVRSVRRYGLDWKLHPAEYFQWHHYFCLSDAVLDTLRKITRAGDHVYDVGANIGFYSAVLARLVGEGGRVTCFEPNPKTYARLRAHILDNGLNNVRCYDVALGDVEEASTLHDFGGQDSGKASLRPRSVEKNVDACEVRVRTLDGIRREAPDERMDVLKVDVEGFEPEALLGASNSIASSLPSICLEWSPRWHVGRQGKADRVVKLLQSLGYRCFEISSLPKSHGVLFPLKWERLTENYNLLLMAPSSEHRLAACNVG